MAKVVRHISVPIHHTPTVTDRRLRLKPREGKAFGPVVVTYKEPKSA